MRPGADCMRSAISSYCYQLNCRAPIAMLQLSVQVLQCPKAELLCDIQSGGDAICEGGDGGFAARSMADGRLQG